MSDEEQLFEIVKKSPFINSLMKDVSEKAYKQGRIDAIDKVLELIEQKRVSAFMSIANTGDEKLDKAYEYVCAYLDSLAEQIKEKNNN